MRGKFDRIYYRSVYDIEAHKDALKITSNPIRLWISLIAIAMVAQHENLAL
jgi:hypothetical protein